MHHFLFILHPSGARNYLLSFSGRPFSFPTLAAARLQIRLFYLTSGYGGPLSLWHIESHPGAPA